MELVSVVCIPGGTLFYKSYRYVPPKRVGFLRRFGLKTGIDFAHFGLESSMIYEGTMIVYQCVCRYNSKWMRKKVWNANSKRILRNLFVAVLLRNCDIISVLYIYLELWKPGQQTFCNFSQLPLSNILFTVLFAYVLFFVFLACLVVRDLCRSGCRQNYYLPPHSSLPTILFLTHVTVISLKSAGAYNWFRCRLAV